MDLLSMVVYQSGGYVAKTLVVRRNSILFVGLKSVWIHTQP